ncbi:MarR family winged helix-turn-helix transcriptional regulator [Jatrophihabitans sp. YIM 134969]
MRTDESAAVDDGLGELFWSVARQLRHQGRETGFPHDVTPSQSRALVTLMRSGAVRLSTLSEQLHIAPRSTTEVVDALEEKGLVARRADPGDRRATLVEVTQAGRDVGVAMRIARMEQAERFFAKLSAADRTRLASILHQLLDD